MKRILLIGATSAIVTETARCWATAGAQLYLLGRSEEKLARLAADLTVRGAAEVAYASFDAAAPETHAELIERAIATLGHLDAVLIGHGTLPEQQEAEQHWDATHAALTTNLLSPIAFLTPLANYFQGQRGGNITVISSVAGDRGRQSNYVYGAAKGGLSIFLQGLRNRLAAHGVSVTTVKPGFVATPMTAHLKQGVLFAAAPTVGPRIYRAMQRGELVVYTPWFWRAIMGIICSIPERIFMRLRL
jgi:short-subunit dehydrogenase